jgi:endonuclease/exonuclease/phosphatase family metal-dependent hydrolase
MDVLLACSWLDHQDYIGFALQVPGSITPSWGNKCPRMCLQVHFIDLLTKRGFWVLNTHLDHESSTARQRGAELIVSKLPKSPDPIILTGDLNAEPASACVSALRHALIDVIGVASPADQVRGTFHAFTGRDLGVMNAIDYIFVSSGVLVHSVKVDRRQYDGRWPSDHFAIKADLTWK